MVVMNKKSGVNIVHIYLVKINSNVSVVRAISYGGARCAQRETAHKVDLK